MSPLFSIVIPTYNRAARVAAAVRSVLAQSDPDFECLVVDDGSTDDTARILGTFTDPRLRVTIETSNRGQHVRRNQALRDARGEWICFLDSDDLFLPSRLAKLRAAIASRPEIGFWFTNAYEHRYGRIIGTLFDINRTIPEGRVPGYYAVGDAFLPYVTTMVCLRRSAFEQTGYFREDLNILEDTELYARMLDGGLMVAAIKEPLAVRCLHEGQITHDHQKDFCEALEALRATNPSADTTDSVRRKLALETASNLLKSLQPHLARKLLVEQFGATSRSYALYYKTFIPIRILSAAKAARRLWLQLRYSPLFAPREFRNAARLIAPII